MAKFVLSAAERDDIAKRVVAMLRRDEEPPWTARQTAKYLGLSLGRVYKIKNEIGYIKTGLAKQSIIRFPKQNVINYRNKLFGYEQNN